MNSANWPQRLDRALNKGCLGLSAQAIAAIPDDGTERWEISTHLIEGGRLVPAQQWIDAVLASESLAQRLDLCCLKMLLSAPRAGQFWINASVHSLEDPWFAHRVAQAIDYSAWMPGQLVFEVTEQAQTSAQTLGTLGTLASFGCGIAIDDFGAGYNSAQKLIDFPVTGLKLNGQLCKEVAQPKARYVLEAFTGMGLEMGLDIVAEWVETETQQRLLTALGIHLFQGYRFGRPVPLGEPQAQCLQP
ncbi:MAG: EAL domain-containing protein [Cyanobacteria bacterium P01_A01_bin.123]